MDILINGMCSDIPETVISQGGHFYHALLTCLGYKPESAPVADLLCQYHGLGGDWLVVSPIHWQATHNDAMIVSTEHKLPWSEAESLYFYQRFKEFAALENRLVHYHDSCTWLMQHTGKPTIHAPAPHCLQNQSLMPALEGLDNTLFWQRFLTEIQMLFNALHDPTLNYAINGVWIWGYGRLKPKSNQHLICHDDPSFKLAHLVSTKVSYNTSLESVSKRGVHLFNQLSQQDYDLLKIKLQKRNVYWYWNNVVYQHKPKTWIARLRGK